MNAIIKQRTAIFAKVLDRLPEIRYVGDPILRTPTEIATIKEASDIAKKLHNTLREYQKITRTGRGLAAPQIGIARSVFITYVNNKLCVYINPNIVRILRETNLYRELCLSSGLMSADVRRPERVAMEWYNVSGQRHEKVFTSFEARLVQHEYDHLLGIPNLDKAEHGSIEFVIRDPLTEQLRK